MDAPLPRPGSSDRRRRGARFPRRAGSAPATAFLLLLLSALVGLPTAAAAQESGGRESGVPDAGIADAGTDPDPTELAGRVASVLELAATEYADAVEGGAVVNEEEYEESLEFTAEAARLFDRLRSLSEAGDVADVAAGIERLRTIVEEKGPRDRYREEAVRLSALLAEGWGAVTVPEPDRLPSAAAGARLYRRSCASCHGASGAGDGPAAEGLRPPPSDLTGPARSAEATPARDFQVVTLGIPATSMEPWGGRLPVEQRWDVVAYVQTLRFSGAEVAEGKSLALGSTADAVDADADDPGPAADAQGGRPVVGASPVAGRLRGWADVGTTARLTDGELAARVREAWTAAAPADSLTREESRAVVAYLRFLLGTPRAGVPEADRREGLFAALDRADSLVRRADALAEGGRPVDARSVAVEAYMAFERIEPDLRARQPELVGELESAFGELRGGIEVPAARAAARDRIVGLLEEARGALAGRATVWSLVNRSFFIILREGFEAILIIGAILTFLLRTGNEDRRRDVHLGVGAALVASVATAFVMQRIVSATPASRELLEGATMLLAVVVLFSVSYWLVSKVAHRKWEAYLQSRVESALGAGSGLALAGVAFLAVYREGFETVLFYQALLAFSEGAVGPVAVGFVAGCVALAVVYVAFREFGVKIPMRPFFVLTSAVLYYMAVVFAGSGIRELQEAGVIGSTPVSGVPEIGLLGIHPTVETLAAQGFLVLLLVVGLLVTFGSSPGRRPEAVSGGEA